MPYFGKVPPLFHKPMGKQPGRMLTVPSALRTNSTSSPCLTCKCFNTSSGRVDRRLFPLTIFLPRMNGSIYSGFIVYEYSYIYKLQRRAYHFPLLRHHLISYPIPFKFFRMSSSSLCDCANSSLSSPVSLFIFTSNGMPSSFSSSMPT